MAKKLNLQPLELLDLSKCKTVSQIVDGMSRCAFGARMLGEVAATLTAWCSKGHQPAIIFDGVADTPLGKLLNKHLVKKAKLFADVLTPEEYENLGKSKRRKIKHAVVVGAFSDRHAATLFAREPGSTIY